MTEILVAMGVFGVFSAGLMSSWFTVQTTAVNAMSYSQRQNDQMRVIDYLKRDIRRATQVAIYNGATPVTDTTTFGNELRLTIPDYYADTREEDHASGPKTTSVPVRTGTDITYGTALTVRFSVVNGAAIRDEAGVPRSVGAAKDSFALSFKNEPDGAIRCRVAYAQPMQGGTGRTLTRSLDFLGYPRFQLQK